MRTILRSAAVGIVLTLITLLVSVLWADIYGPMFDVWHWDDIAAGALIMLTLLILAISLNVGDRQSGWGGAGHSTQVETRGRETVGATPPPMTSASGRQTVHWAVNAIPPLVTAVLLLILF